MSSQTTLANITTTKIQTGPGPEDILIDESTGTSRLLISCMQRRKDEHAYGGIHEFHFGEVKSRPMNIDFGNKSLSFFPHGISASKINHEYCLYAINHEKDGENVNHSVLKFKINGSTLLLDKVYQNPLLHSPNDIFVMPDGSFFITNDNSGSSTWEMIHALLLKGKRGSIVYCDGGHKWTTVIDRLRMPNGIGILNNKLYTTLARGHQLIQFDLEEAGKIKPSSKKVVAEIKGGDNITFQDNQFLITTSHPNDLKFISHYKNPQKISPTRVYRINLHTHQAEILFEDDGTKISAGSTGLIYNNKLYISQIFESFILEIDLNLKVNSL